MLVTEIIKESLSSLKHNKMRTFLSTLGIVIGIASVIALISLGQGTQNTITEQVESLGVNKITLMAFGGGNRDQNALKLSDAEFLRQDIFAHYIQRVEPKLTSNGTFVYQDNSVSGNVNGIDESFFSQEINAEKVISGRILNSDDFNNRERNIVVGSEIVSELFGAGAIPLGERIKYEGQFWTIVGILEEAGSSTSSDTVVYAPLGAVATYVPGLSENELSTIEVTASDSETVTETQNLIKYIYMQRRGISDPDELNLRVFSSKEMLETMETMMGTVTGLLAGIAAISLLVGGIGIMNIMLVTVTERTREIGLRKALGAHRSTIILQFLTESVLLTVFGGIFGFILGVGLAYLGSVFLLQISFSISWFAVVLGIGVSTAIGLLFGIYPANKAAKLQPIEALRYD